MFNLIVSGKGWSESRDTFPLERMFEYTSDKLVTCFNPNGVLDFEAIRGLPTLFMEESSGTEPQYARVGKIIEVSESGGTISLEYSYDSEIAPISNETLKQIARELDIDDFEFNRTHWAIKSQDLFLVLLRHANLKRKQPKVFALRDPEQSDPRLVSAMMPFSAPFCAVYKALQQLFNQYRLKCRRADDIWENPSVIQDVVSLIDKSRIVICDCTGRNPNVFYEAGIAHTLGREVILITQVESDIPFDLRHLRYVSYLNNTEGLQDLKIKLEQRISVLVDK